MDVMLEMKISTRSQRKVKSLLSLSAPQDVQPAQVGGLGGWGGGPNPERVLQLVLLVVSPKPDQRSFSPVCSWSPGSPALGVLLSWGGGGGVQTLGLSLQQADDCRWSWRARQDRWPPSAPCWERGPGPVLTLAQ